MYELRLIIHGELKGDTYSLFICDLEKLGAYYHTGYLGHEVPVIEARYDDGKSSYIGVYDSMDEANAELIAITNAYADAISLMEVKKYECKKSMRLGKFRNNNAEEDDDNE